VAVRFANVEASSRLLQNRKVCHGRGKGKPKVVGTAQSVVGTNTRIPGERKVSATGRLAGGCAERFWPCNVFSRFMDDIAFASATGSIGFSYTFTGGEPNGIYVVGLRLTDPVTGETVALATRTFAK